MSARLLPLLALGLAFAAVGQAQEKPLPKYADTAAAEHAGEEATVTGKVVGVSKSQGGTTYLNFGDRFPRQTFSGVVLARDAEKVGDVKQFEGKEVAISGKIEMSPAMKPQIVITAAKRIALASGAADPAPAEKPASGAPATAAPPKPAARKIVLAPGWNSPTQSGAATRKDLAAVFAGRGKPEENADPAAPIALLPEVPFLASLQEVKKALKLEGATPSKSKVTCPGMPLGSFWAHAFNGIFEGGYARLCLITDSADQVISVQFVEEASRQRVKDFADLAGYHTYNFISHRVKGTGNLVIRHDVTDGPPGVTVVDSFLIDPTDEDGSAASKGSSRSSAKTTTRTQKTGKVLERSRWLVPTPVVNLILRCAGNR